MRGDLFVVLEETRTGERLLERTFTEKHRDMTSVYQKPNVGYLQGEYLADVVSEIIATIERREGRQSPPEGTSRVDSPGGVRAVEETAERLRTLEALRSKGVISDQEYRSRRQRILDDGLGL